MLKFNNLYKFKVVIMSPEMLYQYANDLREELLNKCPSHLALSIIYKSTLEEVNAYKEALKHGEE